MIVATIRVATVADAGAISALIVGLADVFLAPPPDRVAAAPFLATIAPEAMAERLADPAFRYHIAETGGAVVAAVGVGDRSHLYHLFVATPAQGQGLGARLWHAAFADAVAQGGTGAFTVNASLNALDVYRRFGFVEAAPVVHTDGLAFVPMALAAPVPPA